MRSEEEEGSVRSEFLRLVRGEEEEEEGSIRRGMKEGKERLPESTKRRWALGRKEGRRRRFGLKGNQGVSSPLLLRIRSVTSHPPPNHHELIC